MTKRSQGVQSTVATHQVGDPDAWVIKGPRDDEQLYWSNTDGWVDLHSATAFTAKDTKELNLPLEAQGWFELTKEVEANQEA